MSDEKTSREQILGAIRRGLRRGPLAPDQAALLAGRIATHPRHIVPGRAQGSRAKLVGRFVANLEKEFGTVERLPDPAAVPGALAAYLTRQNLPAEFAIAPHPALEAMPWADHPLLHPRVGRAQASDLVSLQHGFVGIAESGTLMLPSAPERPTTLNLLADTEIVVLPASRIVGAYEEAWDRLREENQDTASGGFMPRNVMMVTGPSRSADIEQTLELGAHGPRQLHVMLIEDDPAARLAA